MTRHVVKAVEVSITVALE